jgi:outer membrane protein TolC
MYRLLGFCVLAAAPLAAQQPADTMHVTDTVRLTLDAAIARGLERSEEMRLAAAAVRDARGQVREAFADALPQVSGAVIYQRMFASVFQEFASDTGLSSAFGDTPFGAANQWTLELRASQTLWAGGKVGAGWKAAKSYRTAAEAQARETRAEIVYQVRRAYLDAVTAGRLAHVAEANLDLARQQLRQVRLFHQAGTRAEYDLLRARVDAANQEPVVVAARNGYDIALIELRRLINLPVDQPLELVTPLMADDGTIPVVAEAEVSVESRAALEAAEAGVRVREQLVRVARADRLPTLSLGTTLQEQAFPNEVSPFNEPFRQNWYAEVRLSIPIFQGFRTVGSIQRAEAALERARAERDQTQEQVVLDVARARAEMSRTHALLSARHETVRQAARAHRLAGVRYANGLATQLEVSDARLLRQQAEVNEIGAMRDYLLALAQLERAVGRPLSVERRPVDPAAADPMIEGNQQ